MLEGHRIFGLIGHPLSHSYSARMFNRTFRHKNIDAEYVNYDLNSLSELPRLIAATPQLCGINVTSPYKREVIPLLDFVDDAARVIGAVNTIVVKRGADGVRLLGYNTDSDGFGDTLKEFPDLNTRSALVLGTGGASSAVQFALRQRNIECIVVSRHPCGAQIGYDDLDNRIMRECRLIVNATPLGTEPHVEVCPPLPYELFTAQHLAYDLVYNPAETLFLRRAADAGASTFNGLPMLMNQAARSAVLWGLDVSPLLLSGNFCKPYNP